jgi:hypothetical protein
MGFRARIIHSRPPAEASNNLAGHDQPDGHLTQKKPELFKPERAGDVRRVLSFPAVEQPVNSPRNTGRQQYQSFNLFRHGHFCFPSRDES